MTAFSFALADRARPLEGPLYFVLCDYGPSIGRTYGETDPDRADRETILQRLMRGEYTAPVQVIEVDLLNRTAHDVSTELADEILQRATLDELPRNVAAFVALRSAMGT